MNPGGFGAARSPEVWFKWRYFVRTRDLQICRLSGPECRRPPEQGEVREQIKCFCNLRRCGMSVRRGFVSVVDHEVFSGHFPRFDFKSELVLNGFIQRFVRLPLQLKIVIPIEARHIDDASVQ